MKKVLFLSALDFKEKSIQVIRKTPESYVIAGWEVNCLVARDNCPDGNYFYEDEINIDGVNVTRFYWPFPKVRSYAGRYLGLLLSKLASLIVIIRLFAKAKKLLKSNQYDVIYGYELQGVLAMNLLKPFLPKRTKLVSRFQGSFLNEMFVNKQVLRVIFNLDLVLAIRANSDLLIMTDDGTQGDQAVRKIKGKKPYNMVFWTNGVDLLPKKLGKPFEKSSSLTFMSVSRLVGWKRVDRNLHILNKFLELGYTDFVYYIIGEGEQKAYLEELCNCLGLQKNVIFVGALSHSSVTSFLLNADIFLSMYDSSNVGNPLLEAIRANKIIVTLDNGDTGKWIQHKKHGLIYDPKNIDYSVIAKDMYNLIYDENMKCEILNNVRVLEKTKILTWDERLGKEVTTVGAL
ncbi:Glycosyl transferases group 1 [Halomonas sp. THAF5a]|uniref:glycosyltransferase family 4 protein n=1 Tax=Halomonas sp. THAF5a TaxID=2587844 RepID=UPI001267A744|nr:glycosyltransferase family 4 protein [Halomonas sp. THAF5a]QFU01500.1 Glycosyl transferases group 1 [Halomonas sp. THAF5a]